MLKNQDLQKDIWLKIEKNKDARNCLKFSYFSTKCGRREGSLIQQSRFGEEIENTVFIISCCFYQRLGRINCGLSQLKVANHLPEKQEIWCLQYLGQ